MSLTIRLFTPGDYDDWFPLWRGYQEFYQADLPAEVTRESWRRMLDPSEPTFGALASADGEMIGFVHWIYHRSNWSIGNYCYLQDLFVKADARRHGTGRQLIDYVYREARAAGSSRVYWLTHETNGTAIELYNRVAERTGFIQYRQMIPSLPE